MSAMSDSEKANFILKGISQGIYPSSVYKFRTIEKAIRILEDLEFYFASADTFNDPFDCALDEITNYSLADFNNWVNSGTLQLTPKQISDLKITFNNNSQMFSDIVKNIKNNAVNSRGVLALSENNDNILLWSHYAENHTGVSIKLEIEKDPIFFSIPKRMNYTAAYTPLNYLQNPQNSILETLSTKSIDWSYEEEVRVYKSSVGALKINPKAITDIFFGVKASQSDIIKIKNTCKINNLNHVNFHQAEKKHGLFALGFNPI